MHLHCLCMLTAERLPGEELAQAGVWGFFLRKPGLIETPWPVERVVGVALGLSLE